MEKKDGGAKPLGICYRLFLIMKNFAFHTLKQVTQGRNPSAKTQQKESKPSIGDGVEVNGVMKKEDMGSQFNVSSDKEEGEVSLVPSIITIPVEHQVTVEKETVPMPNAGEKPEDPRRRNQEDDNKKRSVIIKGDGQEGTSNDDKDMLKRRPLMVDETQEKDDDDKSKDKELKKKESSQSQDKKEGVGSNVVRPLKPVSKSPPSNINEKSDAFIRDQRKSFVS